MKRYVLLLAGAAMVMSLTACTTDSKTQTNPIPETSVEATAAKIPDSNAVPAQVVSIYHYSEDGTGIKKDMDAIEGEEMEAQKLVDRMSEYAVMDDNTKVLNFGIKDGILTLDLDKVPQVEGKEEEIMLISIGNTLLENYVDDEVEKVKLLVNGKNYTSSDITHKDTDYLTMYVDYKNFGK